MIELLIKSSNREELPKKIKFEEDIFELNDESKTYKAENGNFLTDSIKFNLSNLNDEVEIIEDEEEIDIQRIKIKNISYVLCDKDFDNNMVTDIFNSFFRENQECIDTLAQALKQLDKKVNSIEQK